MKDCRAITPGGLALTVLVISIAVVSCGDQGTKSAAPGDSNQNTATSTDQSTAAAVAQSSDAPKASAPAKAPGKESAKNSIDETLRDLASAWSKVEGVSAKIKTVAKRDIADRGESQGHGIYNLRMNPTGMQLHYFIESAINFWIDEQRYVTAERVEFATDGKILEQITLQPELRQLKRSRFNPDDVLIVGGRRLIDDVRNNYKIKRMSEETREGRNIVTFHCSVEGEDLDIVHAFDTESGVRVEWTEKDKEGNVLVSIKLEELNTSPVFDESDFALPRFPYYTLVDETGPERKVLPWEEVVKTLSPEELRRLTADDAKPDAPTQGPQPPQNTPPKKPQSDSEHQ